MKRAPTARRPSPTRPPTEPAVDKKLIQLATMPIIELRLLYREVFRVEPPPAFGPDLLRRSIAHRHQEKAHGALSRPAQVRLNQMVTAAAAQPNGQLQIPRQIKPGSELVREWKNKVHRVVVKADGYAYAGKTYTNLSEIASQITGTNWNGPRFFGLRVKAEGTSPNGK